MFLQLLYATTNAVSTTAAQFWGVLHACTGGCTCNYPHTMPNATKSSLRLQVLTRFLFSSSPILYWITAIVVSDSLSLAPSPPSSYSLPLLIRALITQIVCTNQPARVSSSNQMARSVVLYFLAYILLGFLLHCNFYPWT